MATRTVTTKRYATVGEIADFTGLSEGTIRNLLATRERTAFRPVPGRILLDLREVETFVRNSADRRSTRGRKPHGIGINKGGRARTARSAPTGKQER